MQRRDAGAARRSIAPLVALPLYHEIFRDDPLERIADRRYIEKKRGRSDNLISQTAGNLKFHDCPTLVMNLQLTRLDGF